MGAIFKAFYDHDIIDEEVILEWGKKVGKKYVSKALSEKIHEKVKPFITWLKEAEEEESDESDEEVELEFDERVHSSGIKEKKNRLKMERMNPNRQKYRMAMTMTAM